LLKNLVIQDIRVSGSLENHYAPKANVILDQEPFAGSGFIALESTPTPAGVIRLASPMTVEEFARVLYESLREGDHQNLETIYIEQPLGEWPSSCYSRSTFAFGERQIIGYDCALAWYRA
jgi:hypothetical protein